ncbi:MAG: type 4a pilus biogenesis protein PilO [Candidatus Omnitrophica bacterium]|nr:type 4a pilus biogenesis protein PilO [Candidatus Omnitrophota bacterium]
MVIIKFISGLSDQGKKLLVIALMIVVAALFDRLLIDPTMSWLSTIDEQIRKEEEAIKQNVHFLSYKDKILRESQAVDPYVTHHLPKEEEIIAAFLKKIEIVATKANVTLVKVTPSAAQQEPYDLKYSADVECSGQLTDVVTFMHLVNSSNELTKVVKFNLGSPKAETDEIKATMTISKIIVTQR